jgi:hypothetical protein
LLAEVIGWFDLVAPQEVNDDLRGLHGIQAELSDDYATIFNDPGGNRERFAFLYDKRKVSPREEIGELTIPATDLPKIKLPDIPARFVGFDRNPMLASFKSATPSCSSPTLTSTSARTAAAVCPTTRPTRRACPRARPPGHDVSASRPPPTGLTAGCSRRSRSRGGPTDATATGIRTRRTSSRFRERAHTWCSTTRRKATSDRC